MPEPSPRRRAGSTWWTAARSGLSAAATGIAAAMVVVVICWLPDAGVSGHPMSAIKAGLLVFLDSHGGGLILDGVGTGLVPLGMFAALLVIAWRAGRTLVASLAEAGETVPRRIAGLLGVQVAAYLLVCALLVPLSRLGTSHAPFLATVFAALLAFGAVSGLAVLVGSPLGEWTAWRIPVPVQHGARAAGAVVVVYLAAGTILTLGSLILHAGRVMDLSRQVGGGLSGLPIAILGVVCVPNAVVAGASYLAGPGFAVGSGTSVNAFSATHGLLPAFPILGALPDGHGADPVVLGLLALTPVLAGIACAVLVRREAGPGLRSAASAIACAAGLAGLAMVLLGAVAGGPVGTGRLRSVGPSPWQFGVAVALESAVVALLGLGGWWLWERLARRLGTDGPDRTGDRQLVTSSS